MSPLTPSQPRGKAERPAPPGAGSDVDRQTLVDCLARAPFSEASVCACLEIPDLDALEGDGRAKLAARFDGRDLRALLTRLFVLGSPVAADDLHSALTAKEGQTLRALGLVAPLDPSASALAHVYSPVRLVPLSDGSARGRTLFVASDRGDTPDGSAFEPFPDIVFSGHNPLTRQFLRLLPTTETGSVLDLCSGTGVGALVAEATAERVTAVDITERCTDFARFNCWLNSSERVDIRQGDLFDPVRGERFDRILAHPPYVPALSETLIYRDGGETGDRLLRRIIVELPGYLKSGGTFHVLSIGMDTVEAPFEARVREWLGAASSEFDIVFAFGSSMAPDEFARSLVARVAGARPADYDRWMELFERMRVRDVVYGALVGKRFDAEAGDPQTRRVVAGPGTGPDGFEWLLRWFDWLRRPGRRERVLASRPVLAISSQVDVHHRVENGRFVPQSFRLLNDETSFKVQLQTDGWVVSVLSAFDGAKTVAEVYEEANRSDSIPNAFPEGEFVDLACLLVERGFLSLDECGPRRGWVPSS
jgi:SAM-dependent methyltransferase